MIKPIVFFKFSVFDPLLLLPIMRNCGKCFYTNGTVGKARFPICIKHVLVLPYKDTDAIIRTFFIPVQGTEGVIYVTGSDGEKRGYFFFFCC